MRLVKRPIEELELGAGVGASGLELGEDLGGWGGERTGDERDRDQRGPDQDPELDNIRPDDRADPAGEGVHDPDDGEQGDGHDEVGRLHPALEPEEQDRGGDGPGVDPSARRERPPDQEHHAGGFARGCSIAVLEDFVDRGAVEPIEDGQKPERDHDRGDDHPDIGRQISQVVVVRALGHADEGDGREGGRDDRDRDGPRGHLSPAQEVGLGRAGRSSAQPVSRDGQDQEVSPKHDPVGEDEARAESSGLLGWDLSKDKECGHTPISDRRGGGGHNPGSLAIAKRGRRAILTDLMERWQSG